MSNTDAHDHGHPHVHAGASPRPAPARIPVAVGLDTVRQSRGLPGERDRAVQRARILNRFTLGWNTMEIFVALAAGLAAGSVSLIGFGLDAGIEVSAGLILAWRLHQERRDACMRDYDRVATRLIALAFAAVAVYIWFHAVHDLVSASRPDASIVGVVLGTLSLIVMPWLARQKRALAPALGSQAVNADADQTSLCAMLSAVMLGGLGLNAAFGWWWADPVAAIIIGGLAAVTGVRTWRAESLEDTCCA